MKLTALDRFTSKFAPRWTLNRVRARAALDVLARHYEAAQPGRRTSGWNRNRGDANAVTAVALSELRIHARDLIRNNGWARRAQRVIANNTVGWGLRPRPLGAEAERAGALWTEWAESSRCESEGRMTFYGIQHLALRTLTEAGEVLVRARPRRVEDRLPIPLQLQVLEPDYLDTAKDLSTSEAGGPIVQGVEYDALGRRAAYWLFEEHPGSARTSRSGVSRRVPAAEIIHVFYPERPGQARGVSWFGAAIVPLKELDEFEDAELVRQKIAACFAAFVTDIDGAAAAIGEADAADDLVESFEPGMILQLPPGKSVVTASPPAVVEGTFTARHLRKALAALGAPYEQVTGDYSQTNFSSARLARLSHWGDVRDWQWNMLIPQLCAGVWAWAMEAAVTAGLLRSPPGAEWTTPAMPMIEPDREARAAKDAVRTGLMTHDDMVREQGYDPDQFWPAYAAGLRRLDELGIKLDSDVRAVSAAGLTQERVGSRGAD